MKDQDKSKDTRRKFLQSASVILLACGFKMKNRKTETEDRNDFKALNENSNFDIGDRGEEIIKKAADLGYKYEDKYRGCARCTVAALQDAIDFIPEDADLFRTASCLDGGATPSKIANCGAFTGSGMVIGWLCGTGRFGDNKLSH